MNEMLETPDDPLPNRPVNQRKLLAKLVIVIVLLSIAVTGMIFSLHMVLTLPPMPTTEPSTQQSN